jgi:uncharacterized protein
MPSNYTAFAGSKRIASGPPEQVALVVKAALDANGERQLLVFDDINGGLVDFDPARHARGNLGAIGDRTSA